MMPLEHGLALLIFIGRVGDVLSTHFVTPNMVLEMNPFARRFKRFTFATGFLLCGIPYLDVKLGVMVAVPCLLVSASNLSRAWLSRSLGEAEMEALILRAATRSTLPTAVSLAWISGFFFALTGAVLMWLSPEDDFLIWYFGIGVAAHGVIFAIHSTFFFVRIFRRVENASANAA